MSKEDIDWTLFETIEQVVAELVARKMYAGVHRPLAKIAQDSEDIIAVLDQLETLVQYLQTEGRRAELPDAWQQNQDAQVCELRLAYDELLDLVTSILPQRALELLRDKMH
jgi:hypothetical protein